MGFHGLVVVSVLLVALGAGGALAPAHPGGPAPLAAPEFTVSVGATPSFGVAPLAVEFQSSVSSGTPTYYRWSFGDGSTLNGSNQSYAAPEHVYPTAGTYEVVVNVSEGAVHENGSITVHALVPTLTVVLRARPTSGVAPLTVTFQANVTGGSGTYLSLNWSFGDGSVGSGFVVQYTYPRAGNFYATVHVLDSDLDSETVGTWINLTSSPPNASPSTGTIELWVAIGFALGAVAAVAAVALRGRWGLGSVERQLTPPDGAVAGPAVTPAPPPVERPTPAPASAPTAPASPPRSVLRLSQRIVVHLAGQGTLGPYDVAPAPLTQAGMASALGVRQNALTNVLRRLVAAGVVAEDVRHVSGQPRRLKVYHLTPRGELLARELRHRPPPSERVSPSARR